MADDEAMARELMRRFPGRVIWFGNATKAWWAYGAERGLVEAATAEELAERLSGTPRTREVVRLDAVEFPARAARARLRAVAERWGLSGLAGNGELVVSELVTNAFSHAERPVTLTLASDGGRLVIEVADGSTALPVEGTPGENGGFGLTVVQSLADVSVAPSPAGKTIRAILPKT